MHKITLLSIIGLALALAAGCGKKGDDAGKTEASAATDQPKPDEPKPDEVKPDEVKPEEPKLVNKAADEIEWVPLDPNAPDGLKVAWLWGDATKEPNGFFIKVPAKNPGVHHTHTHGYHGVTVAGGPSHVQAGGKKAKPLPPGSYWFEPAGAAHTSQCLGKEECVAIVHFTDGPFDFAPAELDKKGKPDPNYAEKRAKDLKWAPLMPELGDKGPTLAVFWGDPQSEPSGVRFKLPKGFASPPHTHTEDYHAVVLSGTVMNHVPDDANPKEMSAGSYFFQPGGVPHVTSCKADSACEMYIYMLGKFDFAPVGAE